MKHLLPLIGIILLLHVMQSCNNQQKSTLNEADKNELINIVTELEVGVSTGNNQAWQKFMADDAVLINRDGKGYSKAEILEEIIPLPPGKVLDIKPIQVKILANTNESAVVTFIADEKLSIWGQKVDTQYPSVMYFEKRNKVWQMILFSYYEKPIDPKPVTVSKEYLKSLEGTYQVSDSMRIEVTATDTSLTYKKPGSNKPGTVIFPINQHGSFFRSGTESEYIFTKDQAGHEIILQRRNWIDLTWTKQ